MIHLYAYLSKATDILYDYQWVYNFRATHLLVNDILTQIPRDWMKALLDLTDDDLTLLTFGTVKDGWPACLCDFVRRCHELILPHAAMGSVSQSKGWDCIPTELQKGMSPKKQHEVLHLTSFIYHQCLESNLSRILDLGSGLGYLGKLLHHRSGYRVLGLEANAGCVGKAVSMQQPICSSGVKHVALTLRPAHREEEWRTTVDQVRDVLEHQGNWERGCTCGNVGAWAGDGGPGTDDPSICMVSLHSCGDLSPTALRLFLELPQARRLVLMSCCFHKMKSAQGGGCRHRGGKGSEGEVDSGGEHGHRDGSLEGSSEVRKSTSLLAGRDYSVAGEGGCAALEFSYSPSRGKPRVAEGGMVREVAVDAFEDVDEELFPDFPMSSELERLVCARRSFLRRPLLRLASEMTVEMWRLMTAKQRHEHSVHVLGRAVFELYAKRVVVFREGDRLLSHLRHRGWTGKERRQGVRSLTSHPTDGVLTQSALHKAPPVGIEIPLKNIQHRRDLNPGSLERYRLKKMRRRGVRKTQRSNFDDYFEDALQRFDFLPLAPPTATPSSGGGVAANGAVPCPSGSEPLLPPAGGTAAYPTHPAGGLCAPSSDIPFIDEEDVDTGLRTGNCTEGPASSRPDSESLERVDPEGFRRDAIPLEVHRRKLKALTEERCTPEALQLTTSLYALQAAIQAIAEGLVIADRLAFLLERGGPSVEASLVRVFDRSLSPRSLAIVACKGDPLSDVNNK
ncbi:uncharacterized protein [Hetaerina americana]|uniref:uncharacterized protein n=1 Tax=Hetaerina americana TaxID=62018 RepID=UPI003A7F4BCD